MSAVVGIEESLPSECFSGALFETCPSSPTALLHGNWDSGRRDDLRSRSCFQNPCLKRQVFPMGIKKFLFDFCPDSLQTVMMAQAAQNECYAWHAHPSLLAASPFSIQGSARPSHYPWELGNIKRIPHRSGNGPRPGKAAPWLALKYRVCVK